MITRIKHATLFSIFSLFLLFNVACSSDDNDTPAEKEDIKGTLELTVDQDNGKIGTDFTFTVKSNGTIVEGAKIELIGKYPLENNLWKATEEGEFTFKATKVGYTQSNIVKIVIKNNSYFTYDGKNYELNTLRFNFKTPYAYGPYVYDVYNLIFKSTDGKNGFEINVAFLRQDNNAPIYPFAHKVELAKWVEAIFYIDGKKTGEIVNLDSETFINIKALEQFNDLGDYKYESDKAEIEFLFQFNSGKELKGEYFGKASLDFIRE